MNSREIVLWCLAAFLIIPDPYSYPGGWGLDWLGWVSWDAQFGWSINFANKGWASFAMPLSWTVIVALVWVLPLMLVGLIILCSSKGNAYAKATSIVSIILLVSEAYLDWYYLTVAGGTVIIPMEELFLIPIAIFSLKPPQYQPSTGLEGPRSLWRSSTHVVNQLTSRISSYKDWLGYCFAPLLAVEVRVIGAWLLYDVLSVGGTFSTPWLNAYPSLVPTSWNWLWLFNAWDSLKFSSIAANGYAHPNYPYLPGYPILIFLVERLVGNYWLAAFLIAQALALGSIVMFQLLAEQYLGRDEALYATLLMMMFPFISVFTTLSYSEPLFIFSSIAAWYFYKKGHMAASSLMAGLAAVTRIYGFAIVLPVILDVLKRKSYQRLGYVAIPTACLSLWFFFCYLATGNPLVSWTDERAWGIGDGISMVQATLQHGLMGLANCCSGFDPTIFWALGIFAVLIVMVWKVDRFLWVYSAGVAGLIFVSTTYELSLLRFFAFLFPIWLTIRVKNPIIVAVGVSVLVAATVVMWLYTIAGVFLG